MIYVKRCGCGEVLKGADDWCSACWAALVGATSATRPVFAEPVTVVVPTPTGDPYLDYRNREAAFGCEKLAQLTCEHPDNVRARKVAALREQLSAKFEPRFPGEGRSDRVYAVNQERR